MPDGSGRIEVSSPTANQGEGVAAAKAADPAPGHRLNSHDLSNSAGR
jgi:hypothetical protein